MAGMLSSELFPITELKKLIIITTSTFFIVSVDTPIGSFSPKVSFQNLCQHLPK